MFEAFAFQLPELELKGLVQCFSMQIVKNKSFPGAGLGGAAPPPPLLTSNDPYHRYTT